MELRKAELREAEPCDAPRDDPARFLQELRQLRAEASLGHAELAARAHYPCDVIRGAEAGPALPSLPVLSAYVRGCGGTPAEWEERWRSLTRSPASPLLPVRSAGDSDAATAGARVGAVTPAADGHDPDFILAALGRVADSITADPSTSAAITDAEAASIVPDTPAALDAAPAASPVPAVAGSAVPPGGSVVAAGSVSPGADLPGLAGGGAAPDPDSRAIDASIPVAASATATPGGAGTTAQRRPSGTAHGNATARVPSSRGLPPRAVLAAVVAVVLCLVAIILALLT